MAPPSKGKLTFPAEEDIEITQAHTPREGGQTLSQAFAAFKKEAEYERSVAATVQKQQDRLNKAFRNFHDRWKVDIGQLAVIPGSDLEVDNDEVEKALRQTRAALSPEQKEAFDGDLAYMRSLRENFRQVMEGILTEEGKRYEAQWEDAPHLRSPSIIAATVDDPSIEAPPTHDLNRFGGPEGPRSASDLGSHAAYYSRERPKGMADSEPLTGRAEYLEERADALKQEFPEQFDESTRAEAAEASKLYKKPTERR